MLRLGLGCCVGRAGFLCVDVTEMFSPAAAERASLSFTVSSDPVRRYPREGVGSCPAAAGQRRHLVAAGVLSPLWGPLEELLPRALHLSLAHRLREISGTTKIAVSLSLILAKEIELEEENPCARCHSDFLQPCVWDTGALHVDFWRSSWSCSLRWTTSSWFLGASPLLSKQN